MKKLIVSGLLLTASLLSFSSALAYKACLPNESRNQLCSCFIDNCHQNGLGSQCNYTNLVNYFKQVGASTICAQQAQQSHISQQDCMAGINRFINECS